MEDIEDTQYFYEYALSDVYSTDVGKVFSEYEGNESVAEVGDKPHNDLSRTVHVENT